METIEAGNKSEAYKAGYDAGLNKPNTVNSHFTFFATKESLADWQAGKKRGEKVKEMAEFHSRKNPF